MFSFTFVLFFLFFFFLKGPVCFSSFSFTLISLFSALLFEESSVSLILQGGLERGLLGQWTFSGLFSFVFPSKIWEVTVEQGLLTGSFGIPRVLGEGEIRKPAALQRKKLSMAFELS